MHLLKDNPLDQCQLKFASSEGVFEGYASVFNSTDAVNDTILPGAFSDSIGKSTAMFINHDHGEIPVGTWKELREDDVGLYAKGEINMDHMLGPSAYTAMKRGDMTGLSIGFSMTDGDFKRKEEGGRVISKASLKEVSIVTFPCEEKAQITAVKSLEDLKSVERWLRESTGISRSMASALVGQLKNIVREEPGDKDQRITKLQERLASVESILTVKSASRRLIETVNSIGA